MTDQPVSELLQRAAEGDRVAWRSIVDRYHRLVWSVIRGYRLDSSAAEDVFQTVWQRLIENCGRIRDPERLPGWLATTTRNEALRVLRHQKRQIPSEFEYDVADRLAGSVDDSLVESETQRAALVAFGRLPDDAQVLLRLFCSDPPLDYQTISELSGRPVGSLGPTRARILDKLRTLIDEEMEGRAR
ncbi:MAG: sigma-70 family RNA polymerase sigma factor [Acidimicrobiia bacterium]|nr:sigma-70 family RNA polymerase sigma factor [Acidimicrobiia bacterium]MDH5293223.1 sigma-70 family RNA polymerase sigma factor [Acidimicrobiia bacterium]